MRYLAGAALVAAAALAVSGCGSSDSSDTGTAAGTSGSSTQAAQDSGINVDGAKKDLQAIVGDSEQIELSPFDGTRPEGKTINVVSCQLAICTEVADGVTQAAKALGWRTNTIQTDATPAGYKEGWQQAAQNPGDGIVNSASVLPDSAVAGPMKEAGVPIVSVTSPSDPGEQVLAVIDSRSAVARQGAAQGNWVVQDSGKPTKAVFIYDPSIQSIATAADGFREAVKKNCPDCSVDELKTSVQKIGPALSQEVVSYLQRNPDVGYVVFGLGDLATGVPAAVKAAGLSDKVKIVVRAATPPNLQDVKSGGITAAFTDEIYEAGWRAVDVLLRSMAGQPVKDKEPVGKVRLLTKDNLPADISVPFAIPGYQDSFKQAWGVS